jgi:uncharacterized protein YbcC (UPF0753/DUF2309 family)
MNATSHWHQLATTSPYQTAVAVREQLIQGDVEEAIEGIEELIAALSRADRRELNSQLVRLMAHIIKWQSQPERRSRSWLTSIVNARFEIENLLDFEPSLQPLLPELLSKLFPKAKRIAEKEMGKVTPLQTLSWQMVFEDDYELE